MSQTLTEAIRSIKDHPRRARQLYEKVIVRDFLDTPVRTGAWTPRQIFHHLADSHMNSYIRIKLALTEDKPVIKPYAEDRWAELNDTWDVPVSVSLDLLDGIHHRVVAILNHLIASDLKGFERRFIHPEIGEISLKQYIKQFADHGIGHLDAIEKLFDEN